MRFWISRMILLPMKLAWWPLAFINNGFQGFGTIVWPLDDLLGWMNRNGTALEMWGRGLGPEDMENDAVSSNGYDL